MISGFPSREDRGRSSPAAADAAGRIARRAVHAARGRRRAPLVVLLAALLGTACGETAPSVEVTLTIPRGASFAEAVDSLEARGVIEGDTRFRIYAKLKGAEEAKAGTYAFRTGEDWATVLEALNMGRVLTVPVTIPEGFTLDRIAPRLAEIAEIPPDSALASLNREAAAAEWGVPGPTLEGYLFPDTYRFAPGVPFDTVVRAMIDRYQAIWTPERRARLDSLGLSEQETVTLASIIQAEARRPEEMPRISSVYHNRLERGYLLQADPTVLYALGGPRERLLYAAIDSVEDHPYNTYSQPGLPPGPIGAPGEAAIEAALYPADEPYLYFVARPDGTHVFTRTLAEHNQAKAAARREWDSLARSDTSGLDGIE